MSMSASLELRALLFGEPPFARPAAPEAALLGELAPQLRRDQLKQALFICRHAASVPPRTRAAVVADALAAAPDAELRRVALAVLSQRPSLVRWLPMTLLEVLQVQHLLDDLPDEEPQARAGIVAEVAARDALGAQDLLSSELARTAVQLGRQWWAAQACLRLLGQVRVTLSPELAGAVATGAARVGDAADRAQLLAALLPALPAEGRDPVEDAALTVALAVPDARSQSSALLALADHGSVRRRADMLRRVIDHIGTLDADFDAQVELTAAVALRAPTRQGDALIDAARDEVARRGILWPGADALLARALATALETLPPGLEPALEHVVQRLSLAPGFLGDAALRALAPAISVAQRDAAVAAAIQAWRERNTANAGAPEALAALAPQLTPAQLTDVLQALSALAASDEAAAASLIEALAPVLSPATAATAAALAASLHNPWLSGRALLALREQLAPEALSLHGPRIDAVSPARLRALLDALPEHERDSLLTDWLERVWERHAGAAAAESGKPPTHGTAHARPPAAAAEADEPTEPRGSPADTTAPEPSAPEAMSGAEPPESGAASAAAGAGEAPARDAQRLPEQRQQEEPERLLQEQQQPPRKPHQPGKPRHPQEQRQHRGPLPAAERAADRHDPDPPRAPDAEPVDAAVFCPPTVAHAQNFLVQVFLYPPPQAEATRAQAREADAAAERRGVLSLPLDLPRGTRVDLRLEMPALRIDEPDAPLVWRGRVTAAQFEVTVPAEAALGPTLGRIRFSIAGVPAGTLRFQVAVAAAADAAATAQPAEVGVKRYRRAFVSYSSKDRGEVLRRVQAFRIAGLSVFQDVLDLEPGERWERELYREIDNCDVFLLFWSQAAAASPWVGKEIDYALARKQGEEDRPPDIQPVPIEGPPIPAPPQALRHLHFNDALLAHIATAPRV